MGWNKAFTGDIESIGDVADPWGIGYGKGIDKLFKKGEKTVSLTPMKEQWQMDLGKSLSDYVKQYIGKYKPGVDYAGLSKMMTPSPLEQEGLTSLSGLMSRPMPKTFTEAGDVLSKTLTGGYDPMTSPYYDSLRKNVEKERQQTIKQLNQQISKAGLGGTSYRAGKIGDIELESFDKVSDIIAKLQEAERVNQLNAIQTAMNYSTTAEAIPANRLSQLMGYGALPRTLEGVGYEDFKRKQTELSGMNTLAQQLFQSDMPYGMKSMDYQTPSKFDEILKYGKDIASIIAAVKGMGGGGGV